MADARKVVRISDLHTQAYCEYQLNFQWKGVRIVSEQMQNGTIKHEQLEAEHNERMKDAPKVTLDKAIENTSIGKKSIGREVFIQSEGYGLIGKIDEILISPEGIFIIDDKPTDFAYLSDKSQARAYAMCIESEYSNLIRENNLKIFSVIRNRDSKKIVWSEELTKDVTSETLEKIERIRKLAKGEIQFIPTTKPNKCRACQYHKAGVCDRSAVSRSSS